MDNFGTKNFNSWNDLKKQIEDRNVVFCNRREVWWCSLGENIGSEECGENNFFERPVLILKVFNKNLVVVVPITSRPKKDKFHEKILFSHKPGWTILSHVRTISTKRLYRKIEKINLESFTRVLNSYTKIVSE